MLILSMAALVVIQTTECKSISFGENYSASTDKLHTRVKSGGSRVELVLDQNSAAGFSSKGKYLFGSIGMKIKLVSGNSAGTVTAYYLSSDGDQHDEMDFEFLGNSSGEPYILQTNVFAKGKGDREQRMTLWFDPTSGYHTYSLRWNKNIIVFYVEGVPVRVFRNNEALGVPFPNNQAVGIYASLWDGSAWATQGGTVPLDWDAAPFVASFQGFGVDACQVISNTSDSDVASCKASSGNWWNTESYQDLNKDQIGKLRDIRSKYVVYDYCTDTSRFPDPPVECAINWYE
ncbi:hypothetical protein M758_8G071000, partial [Ceratodon purpureus]